MYESFFDLHSHPFELVPNPAYLFLSAAHRKALNYLTYGIRQQSGFILLTGEVGTGKTTLIRRLIKSQLTDVTLSKVFNTKVRSQQMLEMILDDFGVSPTGKDKPSLLRDLNEFLINQYAKGRQCVLIIDEAQNLTHELLEEVRLLSNLENDQHKLLRIILVGQPELKKLLASPELLQLRQRIQVSCHIHPLPLDEINDYVTCRLEAAGNRDAVAFGDGSLEAMHRYTKGVPRLINILGDYLLLDAYANQTREITASAVHEVAADLDFDSHYWNGDQTAEQGADHGDVRPDTRELGPANECGQTELLLQLAGFQTSLRARLDEMGQAIDRLSGDVSTLRGRLEELAGQEQGLPQGASSPTPNVAGKIATYLKHFNSRLKAIEEALPRLETPPGPSPELEAIQSQLAVFQESLGGRFDGLWQTVELLTKDMHAVKDKLEQNANYGDPPSSGSSLHRRQPARSWLGRLIFKAS